jgi:hypothetical protein
MVHDFAEEKKCRFANHAVITLGDAQPHPCRMTHGRYHFPLGMLSGLLDCE